MDRVKKVIFSRVSHLQPPYFISHTHAAAPLIYIKAWGSRAFSFSSSLLCVFLCAAYCLLGSAVTFGCWDIETDWVRHGSFALCVLLLAAAALVCFLSGVGYIFQSRASAQAPFSLHLDGSPRGHFKRDFALVRSFSYYSGSSQCSPALFANQAEDEKEKKSCHCWACRAANSLFLLRWRKYTQERKTHTGGRRNSLNGKMYA